MFDCSLVSRNGKEIVLAYAPLKPMKFIGIDFPVGSISYGYFWEDRNYNVYHWKDQKGDTLLYYFNISRDTAFGKDRVDWVDLIVDVAAIPNSPPRILDLEEVPTDMPIEDVAVIGETTKHIVSSIDGLTCELEQKTTEISQSIQNFSW